MGLLVEELVDGADGVGQPLGMDAVFLHHPQRLGLILHALLHVQSQSTIGQLLVEQVNGVGVVGEDVNMTGIVGYRHGQPGMFESRQHPDKVDISTSPRLQAFLQLPRQRILCHLLSFFPDNVVSHHFTFARSDAAYTQVSII